MHVPDESIKNFNNFDTLDTDLGARVEPVFNPLEPLLSFRYIFIQFTEPDILASLEIR